MPKCDFMQLYWHHTSAWVVSCKFALYFQNTFSEAATRGVLWKKLFLQISQNSQKNICARVSFLIKLQVSVLTPQAFFNKVASAFCLRTSLKGCFWRCVWYPIKHIPAGNYVFKVNTRNIRTRCEICSKLTGKVPQRRQWCRCDIFIINFKHILRLALVFLLLTLSR